MFCVCTRTSLTIRYSCVQLRNRVLVRSFVSALPAQHPSPASHNMLKYAHETCHSLRSRVTVSQRSHPRHSEPSRRSTTTSSQRRAATSWRTERPLFYRPTIRFPFHLHNSHNSNPLPCSLPPAEKRISVTKNIPPDRVERSLAPRPAAGHISRG